MQALIQIGNAVNNIMGIFGSTIIVPVVIFIISMFMRVGVKKSFQGAIYMAVGLTLFNAVLGVLMTAITPYVTAMADHVGIQLPFIDIGWQGASVVVYSGLYLSGARTWAESASVRAEIGRYVSAYGYMELLSVCILGSYRAVYDRKLCTGRCSGGYVQPGGASDRRYYRTVSAGI